MKKLFIILFAFIGSFVNAQDYDFQEMCVACAEAQGYYCGDDPANWTQYAPMGCVQNSWINDGWEDCVDASDEDGAVPTSVEECAPEEVPCDTVYVEIPVIEYVEVIQYDTIIEYETIIETDTIIEIQYEEVLEYIDCDTGLPCNTGMNEILDKSNNTGLMYNLLGQPIRKPENIYIEDGKIKYIIN
jgi:hypothetical protein